ncbi:hypothetical protein EDB81DRAFT_816082 [Dactylonectria macrodidyma]|uniref:Ankyrin repeat protein n=1 Tax=Dactylonectria macrodidyma TaxID=307937 RepID=A0A9P9IGM3_9HYPO|nr:hypothetical protein EDB81DRAFT_816082 [Dactylonectria macrodidyma]
MILVYHSPGLVCPAGWATVGTAAKLNPTSTIISGAFNLSDEIPTSSHLGFFEPYLDVFLAALDPGETAALCCPSSYTTIGGAVKLLLASGMVEIDSRDNNGGTPLSRAAWMARESIVKLLMDSGKVEIDPRDRDGGTPLSGAAFNGHEHTWANRLNGRIVSQTFERFKNIANG